MKETLRRAGRTFVQAFCGYLATTMVTSLSSITDTSLFKSVLMGLIVSGVAAGLAAVMNLPKQ